MDGSFERDGATATAPAAVKKQGVSPKQRRLALMIGPPVLIAIIAAVWLMMSAGYVSTDNAQISAARAPITSSVRARVVEILVTENQKVKAGDFIQPYGVFRGQVLGHEVDQVFGVVEDHLAVW